MQLKNKLRNKRRNSQIQSNTFAGSLLDVCWIV